MGVTDQKLSRLTTLGGEVQSGSYILRIRVHKVLNITFGRFQRGKLIPIPVGECVYIGSALGRKGAMRLGRRLVRHATRTGQQSPHLIRSHLLEICKTIHLEEGNLLPQKGKKLFWHIDYLLDHPAVDLTHIILIRSLKRLEAQLAQILERDPHTFILARGLGANDLPGNTHLLGVKADEVWWASLPGKISQLLGE